MGCESPAAGIRESQKNSAMLLVEGSGQISETDTVGGLESEVPGAQNAAPHAPVGMPAGLSEKPPSKR